MARLRHHTFFSLGQLNVAISELLVDLNKRPFMKLPGCRRSLFEQLDKPMLKPLPRTAYEFVDVRLARVHIDYHIEYDRHYYSYLVQFGLFVCGFQVIDEKLRDQHQNLRLNGLWNRSQGACRR